MIYSILKILKSDYSIGVITYVRRFDTFFKPIVTALEKYFPDVEKNYVLNGHYDQEAQTKYLRNAKEFLDNTTASKVIAYMDNQPLSRCMNQLILHSNAKKILLLNDDISIYQMFRPCLELQIWRRPFLVVNTSWSHFVISKDVIKKVGWFDERYPANGFEDFDYSLRMLLQEKKYILRTMAEHRAYCLGVKNIIANNEDPGWKKISPSVNNKYASVNEEYFFKKWELSKKPKPEYVFVANQGYYGIRSGMETPDFYRRPE